jgi:hypothetical protein
MLCPECFAEMTVVDNGNGDPIWICRCKTVLEYEPGDEGGDDDGYEEMKITAYEGDR